MQNPVVTIALSFLAGILLGNAFLFFPWTVAMLLFVLSAVITLLLHQDRVSGREAAVGAASVLCAAAITIHSAAVLPADHYTKLLALDGSLREAAGKIVTALERSPGRTAFLLSVERIGDTRAAGKIRVVLKEEQPPIGYGDRISIAGKLHPVRGSQNPGGFDYPAYLGRQAVFGVLSVRKGTQPRVIERGSGLFRAVQDRRERIRQAFLARTTGHGSAVLQAMILGEEGGLTNELRNLFLAAGATHILSISGSHLGLVAIICFWTAKNLLFLLPERLYHRLTIGADPRKVAALLAVFPVVFYALLAGGQQATIRSLIMLLAGFAALLADRDHNLLQALAIAGLIILVPAPRAAFDISFQLSFLSVAAILFVVSTIGAALPPAGNWRERIKRNALLLVAVSLSATAATAPLAVYYFNRLSLWGILSNMVIVPFAGLVVVPLGLLSGVLSLLFDSLPFPGLNQWTGDAFVALTSLFAGLPGAMRAFPAPGMTFAAAYLCAVCSLAWILRVRILSRARPLEHSSRTPRPAVLIAIPSIVLLALAALPPFAGTGKDRLLFIDVGQGDCALIETADGKRILIDGGGARDGRFDVGQQVVAPVLWNRGIGTIDLAILSHPHPDHMNGLTSVLRTMAVREVWISGRDEHLEGYEEFRKAAEHQGSAIRVVRAGERRAVGRAEIEILHPGPDFVKAGRRAYEAENNRSLVVRITISKKRLLFPGDIQQEAERRLASSRPDLRSDLLKIPHHGSRTSSTDALLASVRPGVAVVSVGAGNPYRQPSDEVVGRYTAAGIGLYRTDRHGAVLIDMSEGTLSVTPWTSLILKRIKPDEPGSWLEEERENWKRLRIRRSAT